MNTEMKNAKKDFWDRSWEALDPDRIAAYAASIDPAADEIIKFLQQRAVRQVCDAGCGCGLYALKLARFGFSVSGFDLADEAVLLTKKLLSENGHPAEGFGQASVLSTGYPDGCFEAVVCRDVLDHLPLRQGVAALKELRRIVRPGGCLLLTLDATDSEYETEPHETNHDGDYLFTAGKWNGMVFHPYSADEIKKLTAGLDYRLLPSDDGFIVALGAKE